MKKIFHNKIGPALADASTWAAIAGPVGVLGTQVPAPFSTAAYIAAAFAAVVGVLLKGGNDAQP